MEDYKERLVEEQAELKEKLLKLVEFINSEKYYTLSENNKKVLQNQKITMELYLSVLNMRLYEDIDKIFVPDFAMANVFAGIFNNTWSKPFPPITPETKEDEKVYAIPTK